MRALAAVASLAACYSPHLQTGSPCASGPCPTGLVCSPATSTCELTAEPADARGLDALDAREVDARPDAGPTMPLLRQQITNHSDLGSSITAGLPQVPLAGDVLVMIGANNGGSLAGVVGAAPAWTLVAKSDINANVEVWVAVADGSTRAVTITCTGANAPNTIWVGEWTGLVSPAAIDGATAVDGLASPADAGSIATSAPRDLVLLAVGDDAPNAFGVPAPGTWTAATAIVSMTIDQSVWYAISNGAATLDPSVSEMSHGWDAAVVALRIAP